MAPNFIPWLWTVASFFIRQNTGGAYCIATRTTVFDYVSDGQVISTFRHSYHQAQVPLEIYQMVMTAIFNNYHNLPYEKSSIEVFVNNTLKKTSAGFSKDELDIFFLQHVALECVHHLKLNIDERLVYPFLEDKKNFHSQVSAARAMVAFNTNSSKLELLKIISDTTQKHFVQVMCVWTLSELNPKEIKSELVKVSEVASDSENGFGGNSMDPRVCTDIPTGKEALKRLIAKL